MNIAELIVGAVLGLIINELLGNPVSLLVRKCKRIINKYLNRIKSKFNTSQPFEGCFSFGNHSTSVYTIDLKGDSLGISNRNIHITVDPDRSVQETELKEVEYYCNMRAEDEKDVNWNGNPLSLYQYCTSRTEEDESNEISLILLRNKYYTTRIITKNLYEVCPVTGHRMSEYIDLYEFGRKNQYALPNSIGVCFLVDTKDEQVIFARRDKTAGFRAGEWDVSVVEGLEEKKDAPGNRVDIKKVFIRAFREEICNIEDRLFDVTIFGLAFDKKYGQWNFIGKAYCDLTEREIRQKRANGEVEDKWELRELSFQKNDPKSIMSFLSTHKIWDMGLVTVYYALLAMGKSRESIDKAIMKYYR